MSSKKKGRVYGVPQERSAVDYHFAAFKQFPEYREMALFVTNAWGQGLGTAQSCILLGLHAMFATSEKGLPSFDAFKAEFNKALGVEVKERTVVEESEEEPPEDAEPEDEGESFADRVARLAAEARAKPKKRQRRT